jgi:hypothetical protein
MKYIPESYQWEQGDIIVASNFDNVGIRTNNLWVFTNGTGGPLEHGDAFASKVVASGEYKYVGNRKADFK